MISLFWKFIPLAASVDDVRAATTICTVIDLRLYNTIISLFVDRFITGAVTKVRRKSRALTVLQRRERNLVRGLPVLSERFKATKH